jgi:hypothetical protein
MELCENLRDSWSQRFPKHSSRAIIVNAGGINPTLFDLVNSSYAEREAAFKSIFNAASASDGTATIPALTWMTMREYLTTYDWSGEFTPEEVEPWLREAAVMP